MSDISVKELDLLSFFEVEPKKTDPDIPWPYNHYAYRVALGAYVIEFGIAPSYKDLSFSIAHDGVQLHRFEAQSVKDVRYHRDADVETLEIVISDRDSLWLRLRPTLLVTQHVSEIF